MKLWSSWCVASHPIHPLDQPLMCYKASGRQCDKSMSQVQQGNTMISVEAIWHCAVTRCPYVAMLQMVEACTLNHWHSFAALLATLGLLHLKERQPQKAFESLGSALTYDPSNNKVCWVCYREDPVWLKQLWIYSLGLQIKWTYSIIKVM